MIRRALRLYRDGLTGIDRRAYIVVIMTLAAVAARMSLYTFLGIYFTQEVGFSLSLVGLAYLAENVARGVMGPIGGAFSDRAGRRPVLIAAALGSAAVLPLFLLVRTPFELFAWGIALGIAQAPAWPATSALLLDLAPPEKRQTVLSLNYTAVAAGYTLGVVPAGFLLAFGFSALAAMSTVGFVLVAMIAAFGIRGALPDPRAGAARSSLFGDIGRAWRDPPFVLLAVLGLVFPLGIGLIATVAPLYAKVSGLSGSSIGIAIGLSGPFLIFLAIPVASWLAPRGPYRFLAIAAAILAVSYLPFIVSGGFVALALASIVFTFGELVFSSALPTAVSALAPAGLRGAYQGAWAFVFAIGSGAALFLSGLIEARIGWSGTWIAWSAIAAIAAGGLLLARPTFRRLSDARAAEQLKSASPVAARDGAAEDPGA